MNFDRDKIETPEVQSAVPHGTRRGLVLSWILTLGLLGSLATYLATSKPPRLETTTSTNPASEVQVLPNGRLLVPETGPFADQLRKVTVNARGASAPLVEATGTLLAATMSSGSRSSVQWQFATGDLLSAYAELLQADADVAFHSRQVQTTRSLNATRTRAQEQVVDRLRRLVEVGSDSPRELAMEEARLLELRLEAERSVHEVSNALHAAERRQAALTRQLEQAGLSPELLRQGRARQALLVAEIPESRIELVREEQSCSIRFYGHPGDVITGKVARILPTVSAARRTLRVVLVIDNAGGHLRPGMFADVGLGTEERDSLIIPATAVIHIERSDYVLVSESEELTVTEVTVGEVRGSEIEVLSGLSPGATVVGDGAVLLKPAAVEALAVRRRSHP
jgi:cobalt-zinc-cadmium efflux system membrane fusion protein